METNITRSIAINWWKNLTFEEKYNQMIKNKAIIAGYPNRNPESFTGSEIEAIWKNKDDKS